ncbi:MAG: HpcH/HpaI aldolase family protein, partial [Gemmataceae bacterium]
MTLMNLKEKLRAGSPTLGTWLTLGNLHLARYFARAGFDWLTVDLEHYPIDLATAHAQLAAIADAGTGCAALVRVAANTPQDFKLALDMGAHGVIVPMVNTPEEAAAAIAACRYPPAGIRSVGGSFQAINFGISSAEYTATANQRLAI